MQAKTYSLLLLGISQLLTSSLQAGTGGGLTADTTAGTQVTLHNQTFAIQGGIAQGGNLLHSFQEFNVETGQTADFQAAPNTQHIISRVTGPNDSWIDGKIQSTTSDADLYLVNPNGILMGQNARLDVNGAFHVSTADYIKLADGQRVYTDPNQGVTLTVAAPEAFGFLDANIGKIQIKGSQLSVGAGQAISLVSGEVILEDAQLESVGGHIDLLAVSGVNEVQPGSADITNFTAANIKLMDSDLIVDNQADSQTVGKIRLQGDQIIASNSRLNADNNSEADAIGNSVTLKGNSIQFTKGSAINTYANNSGDGGSVSLRAGNIEFSDSALISSVTQGEGQGGSVNLQADKHIQFQGSDIYVDAFGEGTIAGNAGNLTLQAKGIHFSDLSQLNASTIGIGNSGNVILTATDFVRFEGINEDGTIASSISVSTESTEENAGNGGNVTIQANNIQFVDGAQIAAVTWGTGHGGSVHLKAVHQVQFQASSAFIDTYGTMPNAGNSGDLTIQANDIHFSDLAQLSAVAYGSGNGGQVVLNSTGRIHFEGSTDEASSGIYVLTISQEENAGVGGNVSIRARGIKFSDGARISAFTEGAGQGGTVNLKADNTIQFQNGQVFVDTQGIATNAGNAGDLILEAKDIHFSDLAQLSAVTYGTGKGGEVILNATGHIRFEGDNDGISSGIYVLTISQEENAGTSGSVSIQARDIEFFDGARISAFTEGTGQGGTVSLKASNQIQFQRSTIFVDTKSTAKNVGDAGDLILQAKDIYFSNLAQLNARTYGAGRGGDVTLIATDLVRFEGQGEALEADSGIYVFTDSAEQSAGAGGSVNIQANNIEFADYALILATTAGLGLGGAVTLTANNLIQVTGQDTLIAGASLGAGAAGRIHLQAPKLILDDGASISSETGLSGNAGRIALELGELLMQNGAQLTTATHSTGHAGGLNAEGDPLGIFIQADQLTMQSGASISSESTSTGAGGNAGLIQIDVRDAIQMNGSTIKTSTAGQGNAGSIKIGENMQPTSFRMTEGATIESGSSSTEANAGQAGNLVILTGETIEMSGGSAFTTESNNAGGGGILVETRDRLHLQDSKITTSVAGGSGQGGNIEIDPIFIILENSQIQANAHGGDGGNITLVANYLLQSGPSVIEASSELSDDGVINQQAVEVDAGAFQAIAQVEPLDAAQWQEVPCSQRRGGISRLIMAGYDAHPTPFDDLTSSLQVWAQIPLHQEEQPQSQPMIPAALSADFQPMPLSVVQGYSLAAAGSLVGCDYL